jgi:hypothetical protein
VGIGQVEVEEKIPLATLLEELYRQARVEVLRAARNALEEVAEALVQARRATGVRVLVDRHDQESSPSEDLGEGNVIGMQRWMKVPDALDPGRGGTERGHE